MGMETMRKTRLSSLKISTKVALSFVVLVLLQGGVTLIIFTVISSRSQDEAFGTQMKRTVTGIEGYILEVLEDQIVNANLLAGQAKVIDYTDFGLRNLLQRELFVYRTSLGMDLLGVYTRDALFASAGEELPQSEVMENQLRLAFGGEETFFVGITEEDTKLTVLTPIERANEIIGVLSLSRNLDSTFIDKLQVFTESQIVGVFGDQPIVTGNLSQATIERIVETAESGADADTINIDGFVVGSVSLQNLGEPRAMLYCLLDTTDYRTLVRRYNSISLISTFLILSLALLIGMAFYRATFYRPFQHLLEGVNKISAGEMEHDFKVYTEDEFGVLANAFNLMRVNLMNREKELRQLSLYNRLILDNVGAGIMVFDLNGKVTTFNPAAARILAIDLGEGVDALAAQEALPGPFSEVIAAESDGGAFENGREVSISNDGEEMTLSVSTSPLLSRENAKIGVIAIFENITKVKKLEERLAISSRLAALGEMAAGVAHQIRNPLGVMKVSAQMLRDDYEPRSDGDNYSRITHMMINEIDTLNLVISNLLDFARPREIHKMPCRIADVVRSSLASLPLDMRPDLKIETVGLDDVPEVEMDRSLIEQVIANLVLNAIQASPPDGRVEVRATGDEKRLQIDIQDWGPGMDDRTKGQIFNPFYTTKSNGTGLGLSIGHRIVEQHHGTLDVISSTGKGATFRIIL